MSRAAAIIILLLLGMAALAGYALYRATQPIRILPWLSEELGPNPVLTKYTIARLEPGMVFETIADKQGWQIREKDTTLYEKLVLENIDLSVNDVVAPHLYDWYFDGVDDYIAVANSGVYDFGSSLGVAVWFKPELVKTRVLGKGMSGMGAFSWALWISAGTLYAGIRTNNGTADFVYMVSTSQALSPGGWYTALVSYDGAMLKLSVPELAEAPSTAASYDIVNYYSPSIQWGNPANPNFEYFKGRVAAVLVWDAPITSYFNEIENHVIPSIPNALVFCSATFYNGTTYINLFNETMPCEAYGGVARVPAEQPFLWLVKSLESDNKLHFKWFPAGTIIRIKDSSGNVVREFTITGTPANDGQIEDYTISLDTTVLPGATIEAYVPSFKVRVYAPYGSIVKILDSNGNSYGEKEVGASGYADIVLTKAIENAEIVIAAKDYVENKLDIRVQEREDGSIEVTVMDENGVLIPGLLVRIADPSGVVIYAATTGQDGKVLFKPDRPLPEITVEASGVWNGAIHYTTKTFQLSASVEAATITSTPSYTAGNAKWLLVGIGLVALLATTMALVRRR